jgi:hypothetical protein
VKLRAVMRHAAARLVQVRSRRLVAHGEILRAALRAAHSVEADEDARHRLKDQLGDNIHQASHALTMLARMRHQYDLDRAYRLLKAALTDTPVQPSAPESRELFESEARLGTMPLPDAFAFLAQHRPQLRQLETARNVTSDLDEQARRLSGINATGVAEEDLRLSSILGPAAVDCAEPLLQSQLALSIASHYLASPSPNYDGGHVDSYFSAPRKRMTLSSGFDTR